MNYTSNLIRSAVLAGAGLLGACSEESYRHVDRAGLTEKYIVQISENTRMQDDMAAEPTFATYRLFGRDGTSRFEGITASDARNDGFNNWTEDSIAVMKQGGEFCGWGRYGNTVIRPPCDELTLNEAKRELAKAGLAAIVRN